MNVARIVILILLLPSILLAQDRRTQQKFEKHVKANATHYQANQESNKFKPGDLVLFIPTEEARRMYATTFTVKVIQVVDKKNLLACIHAEYTTNYASGPRSGERDLPPFWITNIDTNGLVDGTSTVELPLARCVGTKQYGTTLGTSKTVYQFEPYTIETWMKESKSPSEKPERPQHRLRTWTDATGQFTVKATFSGLGNDLVTLTKEDGQEISVSVEKLSSEDQQYIEELKRR